MNSRLLLLLLIIALSTGFYSLMRKPMIAMNGDNVTVTYQAWINGSSFKPSNISFIVGNESVIKGLELGVIGMYEGGSKNVSIPAILAFGVYNPDIVYAVPNDFFLQNNYSVPPIGTSIVLNDAEGVVIDADEEGIIIDTNHPLAGQDINMTIRLLKIVKR